MRMAASFTDLNLAVMVMGVIMVSMAVVDMI